ncbi:Carotenoid isomerooxygenase [Gryllus bimaculatus]|nr:Carotenoid isomerooxygenase [Gryllus bimaculatus]
MFQTAEPSSMFEEAMIVAKVPARWPFHPGYMHTFGFTENFFVVVEQPLSVSVPAMVKNHVTSSPMAASFRWYPEEQAEDDGVVLSALVWGKGDENKVALLVLDAASWTELGRTEFTTPGPVPKCLHGWFAHDS